MRTAAITSPTSSTQSAQSGRSGQSRHGPSARRCRLLSQSTICLGETSRRKTRADGLALPVWLAPRQLHAGCEATDHSISKLIDLKATYRIAIFLAEALRIAGRYLFPIDTACRFCPNRCLRRDAENRALQTSRAFGQHSLAQKSDEHRDNRLPRVFENSRMCFTIWCISNVHETAMYALFACA